MQNSITLTQLEATVLDLISYGDHYNQNPADSFSNIKEQSDLSAKSLKGVLGSLVKKELIFLITYPGNRPGYEMEDLGFEVLENHQKAQKKEEVVAQEEVVEAVAQEEEIKEVLPTPEKVGEWLVSKVMDEGASAQSFSVDGNVDEVVTFLNDFLSSEGEGIEIYLNTKTEIYLNKEDKNFGNMFFIIGLDEKQVKEALIKTIHFLLEKRVEIQWCSEEIPSLQKIEKEKNLRVIANALSLKTDSCLFLAADKVFLTYEDFTHSEELLKLYFGTNRTTSVAAHNFIVAYLIGEDIYTVHDYFKGAKVMHKENPKFEETIGKRFFPVHLFSIGFVIDQSKSFNANYMVREVDKFTQRKLEVLTTIGN